jgi:hypothetical protein
VEEQNNDHSDRGSSISERERSSANTCGDVNNDAAAANGGNEHGADSNDERYRQEPAYKSLYSDGLEQLRTELELKYNLANIDRISYALAADINCSEASPHDQQDAGHGNDFESGGESADGPALCLLADRTKLARMYRGPRDFTFYPLGFHQRYGNFTSGHPPDFLNNLCAVMRDNMSYQNDGMDVLSFGFFQGYSNIKRSIRSRPDDLLATRGIATAALTMPPSEAARNAAHVQGRQHRLLQRLRGDLTPDQREASTPFARERQRIEAAIEQEQMAFRMEQVVTIRASRLVEARRNFYTVLQPIFQLIRLFLKDSRLYTPALRRFAPSVFPGVLCSFARMFELTLGEMDRRFAAKGDEGLDLALCESVAVLDRLGSYCFTGDPRVLPSTVLEPLTTMESIRRGAWPYISPDMLDFRDLGGSMNVSRWPRTSNDGRPILLHIAALAYHYGSNVATKRHSQIWFGQLGGKAIRDARGAGKFLGDVFRMMWVPQTVSFMTYQLRKDLGRNTRREGVPSEHRMRRLEEARRSLDTWEAGDGPFTMR